MGMVRALRILLQKMSVPGRDMYTKQPSRCYVQLLRVFSTIININCPDGATYSQTI